MRTLRLFAILALVVGSLAVVSGCCGFDPCDPFPDPCGCCPPPDPCAPNPCDPCANTQPAPAAAPSATSAPAASCGGSGKG